MALETIAEAGKYSTTQLLTGVVETIVSESPVLNLLPFEEILGNSLTYNRENTLGTAQFYNPGDTWVEGTPTVTPVTAVLKILGGDADVDKFLAVTRGNLQDLRAQVLAMKAKAVARQFQETFVYGDTAVDAKSFDGLHKTLDGLSGQQLNAGTGATPGAGSFTLLDQLLDLIPGKPDALMLSRRSRRAMNKLARSQGSALQVLPVGSLGFTTEAWAGVPIFVNDFQTDTETIAGGDYSAKTGGTGSTVFALKFGADGLHGLEAGGGITVDDLGTLETKDAVRARIKWYVSIALMSTVAIARLDGISAADWTN